MRKLLAFITIAMACICVKAATPSYENFDPAYFTRSGNTLRVNWTNVSGPTNGITATVATNIAAYQSQIATNNLVRTNDERSLLFTNIIVGGTNGLLGVINPIIEYVNPANGKIIFGSRSGNSLNWFSGDSSLIQFNQNDVTLGTNVIMSGQTINSWDDVTNYFALPSGGDATATTNINNSLFGFDSDALLYCQQRGISNLSDMFKIDGFVRTFKLGGVWTLMVDTWLLRSNLNSINLTNAISWNGKQHTVYGAAAPLYDETGLTFTYNASGALWITNMADMRTNTVVVQAQIDAATWDQTNPLLVLQNGSIFQSFTNSYLGLGVLNSGNSGVQWRQGISNNYSFASWEDHHRLNGFGLTGSFPSDYPRIYATTISNTTWQGWFENIPAGPFTLTPVLATAATPMTSAATGGPLTNMIVGGRATGSGTFASFGGKVQYISIFSRPLTQIEIECVNKAYRYLDAQTENWVFYGDSRFAGYSFDAAGAVGDQRNGFVNQLMNQLGNSDVRFYNMGIPAIDLNQQNASSNFLRCVDFYKPDGRYVKKTRAFVLASGFNTFSDGDSVLTAANLTSNLCAKIHKSGVEVHLFTDATITTSIYATNSAGTGFTNWAAAYNNMVITNTGWYDYLHRYDLAFENSERTTNSGFYTDGVHASAAGNRKWAAFTRKEIMGVGDVIDSLKLQQNGSNAISLTFAGSTINGGSITNGVFYGSGSSLSNAFAIAAGDSSVTLVTNANGRLVTITSTGGSGIATNGGSGINNLFTNASMKNIFLYDITGSVYNQFTTYNTAVFSLGVLAVTNGQLSYFGGSGLLSVKMDTTNVLASAGSSLNAVGITNGSVTIPGNLSVAGTANYGTVNATNFTVAGQSNGVAIINSDSSVTASNSITLSSANPVLFNTNTASGNWIRETNGIITLGPTNAAATVFISGITGGITNASAIVVTNANQANLTRLLLNGAQNGATGNVIDYTTNNVSKFSVDTAGTVNVQTLSVGGGVSTLNSSGSFIGKFQGKYTTQVKTTSTTLNTTGDSFNCFNNSGAGGGVTNTLPASAVGLTYKGAVVASQIFCFKAAGSDVIRYGGTVTGAAGGIYASTPGMCIELICDVAGTWTVHSVQAIYTAGAISTDWTTF